jgi:hypothetical protein
VIENVPLAWLITAVGCALEPKLAETAQAATATIAARDIHRDSGREPMSGSR